MKLGNIKLSNYCHYIFFFLFLLLGLSIYKDYGFNIDEAFQRRSGFYWLNFLAEFFRLDSLAYIANEKFNNAIDFTMPWKETDKTYGLIFDVPAALLEILFNLKDPLKFYEMRHLLTFLYFFIGSIYFYKLLVNRFGNRYISLLGCLLLIITPRVFGEFFHNNKDIIFLSIFIITSYYYFKTIDNNNYKNIILFALLSAICTSTRILGLIFPITFLFIYLLSILSQKNDLKIINKVVTYFLFYIFFLVLHWPFLWDNPIKNFIFLITNLENFGPSIIFFNDNFFNTALVPYYYLSLWILISTPILNILLFLCGFFLSAKIYIKKLFNFEKHSPKYDFWDNNIEKKDFFILILFLIFFISGTFFTSKHYNSWRIFYFLNFFMVYFSIFFINSYLLKLKYKKNFKIVVIFLSLTILFNSYRVLLYHPYQSLYFNVLTTKKFKNQFEVDFTGLSGIEFLRLILKIDKRSEIKIGINSWYPLWRMKELLPEFDKKRIVFMYDDIKKADYVYSNRIYNVNAKKSNKFVLDDSFKPFKKLIIDGLIIYEIHKKN